MPNMWRRLAGAHCAPLRGADEMRDGWIRVAGRSVPVGAHIVRPGGKSAVFWCMSNMWGGLAGAHCAPLRGADEMRDGWIRVAGRSVPVGAHIVRPGGKPAGFPMFVKCVVPAGGRTLCAPTGCG